MSAPPIVWIDERIAKGLPQAKDEELAERGVDQIRYVSQERVNDLVNAAIGPDELIIQIQNVVEQRQLGDVSRLDSKLIALTNQGRLFAAEWDNDGVPIWGKLTLPDLEP